MVHCTFSWLVLAVHSESPAHCPLAPFWRVPAGPDFSSDDPYRVLGLSRAASSGEVRKSYKKLSLSFHPDKSNDPDARQKFTAIANAYSVRTKLMSSECPVSSHRVPPQARIGRAPLPAVYRRISVARSPALRS